MAFIGVFPCCLSAIARIIACGKQPFQHSIPSFLLMHPSMKPLLLRTNIAA
ncbi:hypothetical protein [Rhizobium leguminosarum]|uniref:hypothetical protein n=1 Tax=Rhizobium TaxID=379 RepID=UPI0013EE66DA|nr:hypothetical protein [Rhizobium leguminosarum]